MNNTLVFACIAPHGTMLVPPIAGRDGEKALATRAAMEELGRRMLAARPDTVVLMTPHGTTVDGVFSLLHTQRVRGELGRLFDSGGNANSVSLDFAVDRMLDDAILEATQRLEIPVARVGYGVPDSPDYSLALDFGARVPLWFMGGTWHPQPQVVIACPDRAVLAPDHYPRFGAAIRHAAEALGRRIALIASADLGHGHDQESRFGYDPASAAFDAAVVEAVRAQDLGRLLTYDSAWLQRARTDAYGQVLTLHGAIEGTALRGELLSYEVPTYYGMMCAAYEPVGA